MSKVKTWRVNKLVHGESVDFVTYAGAGGSAEALEALRESGGGCAATSTARKQLEEERNMSEQSVAEQLANERAAKTTAESERDTALETRDKALAEAKDAKAKVAEAERKGRIAVNKTALEEALGKCKTLPDASKQRIRERFKDFSEAQGLEDKVKEAITAEEKFLKDVGAKVGKPAAGNGNSGKPAGVQGMGEAGKAANTREGESGDDEEGDPEAEHKALIESFQRGGMSEAAAKEAAEEYRPVAAAKK